MDNARILRYNNFIRNKRGKTIIRQIVLDIPDEALLALKVPLEEAGAALRMAAAGEKRGRLLLN
jgi:hypothetical protein